MHQQPSSRPIEFALLGVLAVMLWPVWLAAAAAEAVLRLDPRGLDVAREMLRAASR